MLPPPCTLQKTCTVVGKLYSDGGVMLDESNRRSHSSTCSSNTRNTLAHVLNQAVSPSVNQQDKSLYFVLSQFITMLPNGLIRAVESLN